MDSNQNDNNIAPQVQAPNPTIPVSIPHGGAEGPPVVLNPSQEAVSNEAVESMIEIEHGPEFAPPPELTNEVMNAGVVSHQTLPKIDDAAKNAGVAHSIPEGYPSSFQNVAAAQQIIETGKATEGIFGKAIKFVRQFNRSLIGTKPAEV